MCGRKPRGARWLGLLSRPGAGLLVARLVVGPYSEGMDPRIHFSAESLAKIKERMAGSEPSTPRPSATVILLRDGERGPEAYLQKRQSSMVFGGRPVFPGGKVDAADSAEIDAWHGPSPEEWAQRLGVSADEARGLLVAAARETFEESGYLLATAADGGELTALNTDEWRADREAVDAREMSFADLLRKHGLVLRTDWLTPWSVWVTPEVEPRRFHTWFFLAACPVGQEVLGVSAESTVDGWITPEDAVRKSVAGELQLMPPQLCTFVELYGHTGVREVLAGNRDVLEVRPFVVENSDGSGHLELPEKLIRLADEVGRAVL